MAFPRISERKPRIDRTSAPAGGPVPAPAPSRAYANYVLGLLVVVYIVNFLDRSILAILTEAIKREMDVSDTALGLLGGPAFALIYSIAGVPVARWADSGSRRSIMALGLAFW